MRHGSGRRGAHIIGVARPPAGAASQQNSQARVGLPPHVPAAALSLAQLHAPTLAPSRAAPRARHPGGTPPRVTELPMLQAHLSTSVVLPWKVPRPSPAPEGLSRWGGLVTRAALSLGAHIHPPHQFLCCVGPVLTPGEIEPCWAPHCSVPWCWAPPLLHSQAQPGTARHKCSPARLATLLIQD